uniref:Uncharacterized protein n=1 Tax=Tetranychus urticae TaxID=32264 RepID=T1L5R1_TETUR
MASTPILQSSKQCLQKQSDDWFFLPIMEDKENSSQNSQDPNISQNTGVIGGQTNEKGTDASREGNEVEYDADADAIEAAHCINTMKDLIDAPPVVDTDIAAKEKSSLDGEVSSGRGTMSSNMLEDDLDPILDDLGSLDLFVSDPNYTATVILNNLGSAINSMLEEYKVKWQTKVLGQLNDGSAQTSWKDGLGGKNVADAKPIDIILAHIPYAARKQVDILFKQIDNHLQHTKRITKRFEYYLNICRSFGSDVQEDERLLENVLGTGGELHNLMVANETFDWYAGCTSKYVKPAEAYDVLSEFSSGAETIGPNLDVLNEPDPVEFPEVQVQLQVQRTSIVPTPSTSRGATGNSTPSNPKRKVFPLTPPSLSKRTKQLKIDDLFESTPVKPASPKNHRVFKYRFPTFSEEDEEEVVEVEPTNKRSPIANVRDYMPDADTSDEELDDFISRFADATDIPNASLVSVRKCTQKHCLYVEKLDIGSNIGKHYSSFHPNKVDIKDKYIKMALPDKQFDFLSMIKRGVSDEMNLIKRTYQGKWSEDVVALGPVITKRVLNRFVSLAPEPAMMNTEVNIVVNATQILCQYQTIRIKLKSATDSRVKRCKSPTQTGLRMCNKVVPPTRTLQFLEGILQMDKQPAQQSMHSLSALNRDEDRFAGEIIVGARKLVSAAAAELDAFNEDLLKKSVELQRSRVKDAGGVETQVESGEIDTRRVIDIILESINPADSGALLDIRIAVENYLFMAEKMVTRLKTLVDKTTHISKKHYRTYGFIRDYHNSLKELDATFLPTAPKEWYQPEKLITGKLDIPERKVTPVLSDPAERKQRGSRSSESSETARALEKSRSKTLSVTKNKPAERTEPDNPNQDDLILVQLCLHKVCPYVAYNVTSEDFKNHYREFHPKGRIPADIYHVVRMRRSEYKRQRNQWEMFYSRK